MSTACSPFSLKIVSERLRLALTQLRLSQNQCGLNQVDRILFRFGNTYRFNLFNALLTQTIDPYPITLGIEVLLQFILQHQQLLLRQKTFKKRELRPLAETLQQLVDFSTPLILRIA